MSSLASSSPPRQDLWNQTKITRERTQLVTHRILQICQPSHILSDLKQLSFNLTVDPADAEVFLLDAYCAPVLAIKLKTEGKLKIVKGTAEFQGATLIESVVYNSAVNQWERLLELASEKVAPVRFSFLVGQVDMTQVVDNMEEIPIVGTGMYSLLQYFIHGSFDRHQYAQFHRR